MPSAAPLYDKQLEALNEAAPPHGRVSFTQSVPFGARLQINCYQLENGLRILLVPDKSAPVVAFHAWFRVGSRHERAGKTGLAHLFEHLMFNEVEGLKAGEFDKKLEAAGADNNASTWLDFTQYQESFPKRHLKMVLDLEARRMSRLVLREPELLSELEVVKNERRFRVEDDVEGSTQELLWKTAFQKHAYQWPTIGWMKDIEGFNLKDCEEFYRAFYAPNNASLVLVGDLNQRQALGYISQFYGRIPASELPIEDNRPEPPQTEERRVELSQPTPTEKLALGFRGPALGDADHPTMSVLAEVLFGGRASRVYRRLIRSDEIASEVTGYVGPHRDPSLIEISASARGAATGEQLLAAIDEELERTTREAVSKDELSRATARLEFGLLGGLETADGKASTIGFFECVLTEPAAAFQRVEAMKRVDASDIIRVARKYFTNSSRTVVFVRPQVSDDNSEKLS